MNKTTCTAVVLAVILATTPTLAGTRGPTPTPQNDLGAFRDLSWLSLGGSYQVQKREVKDRQGNVSVIKVSEGLAQVGIDLTDWLTLHGTAGMAKLHPEAPPYLEDRDTTWGAGIKARFGEHAIEGPELLAGKTSFQIGIQFSDYEVGQEEDKVRWEEWMSHLLLRYELFARGHAEEYTSPYSTAFFVGPVWSDLSGAFDSRQQIGVMAGFSIYATRNISAEFEVQSYEEVTYGLHLGYHF